LKPSERQKEKNRQDGGLKAAATKAEKKKEQRDKPAATKDRKNL